MTPSAAAGDSARSRWNFGGRTIEISKPVLLGIVNVTPDSFSDGGDSYSLDRGIARALEVLEQGADVADIGGESTRPGAAPVSEDEELRRVIPVIEGVLAARPDAVISVDTVKSGVARHALDSGASIVNDVSGFRLDDGMAGVCSAARCGVILMHSRGSVAEMASYAHASYGTDVTGEVIRELGTSVERALAAGVERSSIVVDPGFGFSKTSEHSLAVLRELERVRGMGFPVMIGVSRKRMIGELTGVERAVERDLGSVGVAVVALTRGAGVFRVHDVRGHRQALDAAWGVLSSQL
ncbi:MAG TPA: dihydropteroate synthase [Gemmatimonadaceae bacterium]|nr:dihydropteroate synthase [Gemmatimonadaceae bacterium]